ncbi:hypothetical protein MRS76_13470 [Rhizobiaceae bacterium n13]|uniref:Uncharacterized protein n=1 Tax=Ferirhizobium litorale TaxID=2927786 RepID=A0AAE3QF85_9HYPH|nr:hypothetical protein [Fererhizobium litorale]MDI7862967.1 hypothetical protein [Fererhizobium litorale]MDI7924040.1 hypothetical protein [Fererhizobium litorale]
MVTAPPLDGALKGQEAPGSDLSEGLAAMLEPPSVLPPLAFEPDAEGREGLPGQTNQPVRLKATILDALSALQEPDAETNAEGNYISSVHSDDNGLYRFFRSRS